MCKKQIKIRQAVFDFEIDWSLSRKQRNKKVHALNGNHRSVLKRAVKNDKGNSIIAITWNCGGKVNFPILEIMAEENGVNVVCLQEVGVWVVPPQNFFEKWKWYKTGLVAIGISEELIPMIKGTDSMEEFMSGSVLRLKLNYSETDWVYIENIYGPQCNKRQFRPKFWEEWENRNH